MSGGPSALRRLFTASAIALAMGLAVAACGGAGTTSTTPGANATSSLVPPAEGSPNSSGAGASAQASPAVTSPVSGLVLHVDLAGLGKVTGFRLLTSTGAQLDFKMGVQENAAEFPAAHLSEHMAGGQPVLVYFRQSGSDLVVYRLDDAPPASGSAQPAPSSGSAGPSDMPIGSPFPNEVPGAPSAS